MPSRQSPNAIIHGLPRTTGFLLVGVLLVVSGCSHNLAHLTILSTTDFHGALESTKRDAEGRPLGGAASLAVAIDRHRAENPHGTLYLDAGDSLNGTALSSLTQGRPVVELMELLGLDATAIGNHEFDFGVPALRDRIGEASFPFLAANIIYKDTDAVPDWVTPYEIFDLVGLRVAVIGLATVSTPVTTLPANVEPFVFLDPAPLVNDWVARLVPTEADLVVVVGHLGIGRGNGNRASTGELVQLASQVQGVAAFVGGHTHRVFTGKVDGVPVVQAGDSGTALGRIDLTYNTKKRKIRSSRVRAFPIVANPEDDRPAVQQLVATYRPQVDALMQEVLAHAGAEIARSRNGESAMSNLVTDAWRSQIEVDFVFQNRGGVRSSLESGPITYEDLFRVLPFENTLVELRLTGAEIEELLVQAVEQGRPPLDASGLRYVLDLSQQPATLISTEPVLQPDRRYRVSVNNFMAQGGDGLELLKAQPEAIDTGIPFRDAVAAWLRAETAAGRKIQPLVDQRLQIIRSQ